MPKEKRPKEKKSRKSRKRGNCVGQRQYPNREQARQYADYMKNNKGVLGVTPYLCTVCGHHHLKYPDNHPTIVSVD